MKKTPAKGIPEGMGGPEAVRRSLEARQYRYMRQFPGKKDKKTGKPLEYDIPKPLALYLLDGPDKYERLEASSRQQPCSSYSGLSLVWKEEREASGSS